MNLIQNGVKDKNGKWINPSENITIDYCPTGQKEIQVNDINDIINIMKIIE